MPPPITTTAGASTHVNPGQYPWLLPGWTGQASFPGGQASFAGHAFPGGQSSSASHASYWFSFLPDAKLHLSWIHG